MSEAATIGEAVAAVRARLGAAHFEQPNLEARLLVTSASRLPREAIVYEPECSLDDDARQRLEHLIERRLAHEPIAYILREREFWSLPLTVTPDVLIPRPDSETIVEAALALAPRHRALTILDLGTGSGCLLLALLSELPDAWGLGVDISPAALAVARLNASRLGLTARVAFLCADWGAALRGNFDFILCNPPYVSTGEMATLSAEVARFEPDRALHGGPDGLAACRRLLPWLPPLKAKGGHIFIEIAADRSTATAELAQSFGLQLVEIKHDLSGRPRCLHFI